MQGPVRSMLLAQNPPLTDTIWGSFLSFVPMSWGDCEPSRQPLGRMFPNMCSTLETGPQTPGLTPRPVYSLFGLHSNFIPHVSPCCWKGILPAGSLRSPAALFLNSLPSLSAALGWLRVGHCFASACACLCQDREGRAV